MIDEEISKIIRNAQRVSETILNDNEDLLHSMAKSLLMHETIDAKDIDKLLTGKKIIRRKVAGFIYLFNQTLVQTPSGCSIPFQILRLSGSKHQGRGLVPATLRLKV